ncbi:MAG: MBL fold metallo-hydrolase [bacterium]
MNFIEFFGTIVKPKQTKGKGLWVPCDNLEIENNIFAIKDKDVNMFLIKSDNGYIAIDSGYKNSINVKKGFETLNINPEKVHTVLLTHVDLDHAGGVDSNSYKIFPNAKIYLSEEESKYLNRKLFRKKILGVNLSSPISIHKGYTLLEDNQSFNIDGVDITSIFTPGHTLGHTSYLINEKKLFVGDTLIIGDKGGFCFMDFWNINSNLNIKSLHKQYSLCKEKNVDLIITSHSGITSDIDFAFNNIDKMPNWKKKDFVFRKDAEYNPYI